MKMGTRLLSFLAAGVLCVQGGIMTAAEEPSLLCPRRSYQEVSVSDFVSSSCKLTRQNSDYQEIHSLGEEIVESVNLWLGVHLERPLQIQDIQWEHFYKIYITLEDLYSIQTTQDLLETLETGYARWEGYIFLEEDVVSVQLEQHSDQGENHWTVVSAGFTETEYMPGYDAAIKAGMDASSQEVSQAVLVCSGNGMTVCLLCSDTIDTMVTVSETEVIGDAGYLQNISVPGTQPKDGIFDFRQVAAHSKPFSPELPFSEIPEGGRLVGEMPQMDYCGIAQRDQVFGTGIRMVMGMAVIAAAATVGVLIWRHRNKKKQS